jgi:hypothetical protein
MSNFGTLKLQAEKLLSQIEDGKKFLVVDVKARLNKASDEFYKDKVITSMSHIIDKMSYDNPGRIISQKELESIYNNLYSLNTSTRFREILGDLLLSKKVESKKTNENINASQEFPPVEHPLKKEFEPLFYKENNKFSQNDVSKAQKNIEKELVILGFNDAKVNFSGGDSKMLVFVVDFLTKNGNLKTYIPIESHSPYVEGFLTSDGLKKFTYSNVLNFIKQFENTNVGLDNSALINRISAELPDLEIKKVQLPKELSPLVANIDEQVLEASIGFHSDVIKSAKNMIVTELSNMGYKQAKIRILEASSDGFICEAGFNSPKGIITIEIPVEINNNKPLLPSVFAKGDFVDDFKPANLASFILKECGEARSFISRFSNMSNLNVHQLKEVIIASLAKGDIKTCDDAIEIAANKLDNEQYKNLVMEYNKQLKQIDDVKKNLKASFDDDNFIMTPNSIYPIHKILGLPAHKLHKDENGNWRRTAENQEAVKAFFSNAKILIGD